MKKNEFKLLKNKITKEIENYRNDMYKQPSEFVYKHNYEISVFEELYCFLYNLGYEFTYKGFPENNILEYFFLKFMKTGYDLCEEDLRDFFYDKTTEYKKNHKEFSL